MCTINVNMVRGHSYKTVSGICLGEERSDNPSTPFNPCQIAKIFSIVHEHHRSEMVLAAL